MRGCRCHGIRQAILPHSELRQPIIAAIETLEIRGQALCVDARHFTGMCVDLDGLEIATLESAALRDQTGQDRSDTFTDASMVAVNSERTSG